MVLQTVAGNKDAVYSTDKLHHGRFVNNEDFINKNENLNYIEGHQRFLSRNMQQTLVAYET